MKHCFSAIVVLVTTLLSTSIINAQAYDPLPSWHEGKAKQAIIHFVKEVTKQGGENYVPPAKRIATFDNDGTLWVEYPMYTQLAFTFDRVKELAPQHPEWRLKQPYKGVLEHDVKAIGAMGSKELLEIVLVTHTGMTAKAFEHDVLDWLQHAKHPRFQRLYTELIYQPQLELLAYLRDHGFKNFIVSGGGTGFMRPVSEQIYGIPPEQVLGSNMVSEFVMKDGAYKLMRMPKMRFVNDKADKVVGIYEHIGRRPILAFGNSDSDMQMITYAKAGKGLSLALFVHHTDAKREFSYDRKSHVGKLDKVLNIAKQHDWIVVDMQKDWQVVFPFERIQ
jgi:phosphoserine phosphatase